MEVGWRRGWRRGWRGRGLGLRHLNICDEIYVLWCDRLKRWMSYLFMNGC